MKTQSKNKKALLVGAVVYDTLFDLSSSITDQIVVTNGKASRQNLMFNAKNKEVYFGGPAGNVAYGLSLLNENPILTSLAGKDFGEYSLHLKRLGVDSRVHINNIGHTAMFYGMTDVDSQQMGIFQSNTYHSHLKKFPISKLLKKSDWKNISVGLFSPGTAQSIIRDMKEFKKLTSKDSIAIFDPGQMLAVDFDATTFIKAVSIADILIVNETEAHFFKTKFNVSLEKLWELGLAKCIITLGEKGSALHTKQGVIFIKPHKAKKVVDPTGAGDAFRAGLIHGMLSGKTFIEGMNIGAKLGARCVENKGGQMYKV